MTTTISQPPVAPATAAREIAMSWSGVLLVAVDRHSFVAFYPSDWLGGTARLPRLHRSVFFDVCCYVWDTARRVSDRELRLMIADLPNGAEIVEDLLAMGKLDRAEDGSISNAKALHEAEKAYGAWMGMSKGGKKARAKDDGKVDRKGDEKVLSSTIPQNQNQNQNQQEGETPNPFAGEAWDGWIEARKKKPTERAIKLAISTLTKLQAEGHNPDDVLNQSTMNGWTGLFPLKGRTNGADIRGGGWNGDKRSGLGRAIDRELER